MPPRQGRHLKAGVSEFPQRVALTGINKTDWEGLAVGPFSFPSSLKQPLKALRSPFGSLQSCNFLIIFLLGLIFLFFHFCYLLCLFTCGIRYKAGKMRGPSPSQPSIYKESIFLKCPHYECSNFYCIVKGDRMHFKTVFRLIVSFKILWLLIQQLFYFSFFHIVPPGRQLKCTTMVLSGTPRARGISLPHHWELVSLWSDFVIRIYLVLSKEIKGPQVSRTLLLIL